MMSMWTLRSLAVLSALLILEAPRYSMALPKSWMKGVHPKEESASEIDHSAAAAAAQDLMDQLDTGASLDDLLDNGDSSDEVEESMQNLETPALKTREYNPVDPPYGQEPKPYNPEPPKPYNPEPPTPYGQDPKYGQDPEPYRQEPKPYNSEPPKPYNPEPPTPYGQDPKPYDQDPKPYGQDSTYGKDPYCRTYYDYVYDKKCKDYKDKVCYTTNTEYCDDVDKDSCKAVMKKNEVQKCYNVEELICGLVETLTYEIVQAKHTIQKCYPVKERVCDTVYLLDHPPLRSSVTDQCVNLKTYYCNKKDKTLYDKTCRHITKYDCKYDSYDKKGYEKSEYETTDKYAVDSYGKTEGYGETGSYGKTEGYGETKGYGKTDYSYKEPNCTYKTEVKCYDTPRTVTTLDCYDKYEKECKKMPEQKPYPVEKQSCHYDEKQVCEMKEIS